MKKLFLRAAGLPADEDLYVSLMRITLLIWSAAATAFALWFVMAVVS